MPNVSPDGRSVAFAAQTLARLQFWEFQVHVLDLATGETRALDNSGGACWPAWSPDGRSLANVLLATEPSTIQVRGADGEGARTLPVAPAMWHYYPDWSRRRPVAGHVGQSRTPRRRRLGPGDRARRRLAAAAATDLRPGQRSLARLEAVTQNLGVRRFLLLAALALGGCTQQTQTHHRRPAEAMHRRRHPGRRLVRHPQGVREPRHQTGPPDRPEHRRAAGAARRRRARSAVLPRRRTRARAPPRWPRWSARCTAGADRSRHRARRPARHRQVESARLRSIRTTRCRR